MTDELRYNAGVGKTESKDDPSVIIRAYHWEAAADG